MDTDLQQVLSRLVSIEQKLTVMNGKLDDLLDDYAEDETDENIKTVSSPDDFISEEEIRQNGQKVPYNKLQDKEQMRNFREFLSYVRMHEKEFTTKEYEFAGFADKNFSDIRISDNSRRILGTAYQKAYHRPWSFSFLRGYMFKWRNQVAWEWQDGTYD